ncbi:hypothetical protein E1B28_008471 [Marasmius oreades]|uniref:Uncharacterized protein n=1 Tax=Marasmius oreades TaxID=181124 RepID=A0A9P7RZ42_9AGAR|nr:uncharacterized protein E1B28_008471 [Marasmius oreades]KAG7092095.1 hypothetical protein E1B28_008471 [Marasmius oreades]
MELFFGVSLTRSTHPSILGSTSLRSADLPVVVCGVIGSAIIYFGDLLQSGDGSTTLFFIITVVFVTRLSLSLTENVASRSLRQNSSARTSVLANFLYLAAGVASFFASWQAPTTLTTPSTATMSTVLPLLVYITNFALLAAGIKLTTGLGLCSPFAEAQGICKDKFQQDFSDVVFYHLLLLAIAMIQDTLLGLIQPFPKKFLPAVRRLRTPYAFVLFPTFFQLHHTSLWARMIPLMAEGVDSLVFHLASGLLPAPALTFERFAQSLIGPPASLWPTRFSGLAVVAIILVFAPTVIGYRNRYSIFIVAGVLLLVMPALPWDISEEVSSVIVLVFAFSLFNRIFKSSSSISGYGTLSLTILNQVLLVFWSLLFRYSEEVKNEYFRAEIPAIQRALVATSGSSKPLPDQPHSVWCATPSLAYALLDTD